MTLALPILTPLDEPIVSGLLVEHRRVQIGEEVWERGDVFFLPDQHGVPREYVFMYWNAACPLPTCFRKQRYKPRYGAPSLPAGFCVIWPTRSVEPQMSGDNLTFAQLLSDAEDDGADPAILDQMRIDWAGAVSRVRARLLEQAKQLVEALDVETDLL